MTAKWFVWFVLCTNIVVAETQLTWQDLQKNIDSWIDGPVSLLLTDQERGVYKKLGTPEDRMQFIKIFWARRDPILRTRENEFKEEFTARVDAVNDRFAEGKTPGWKTARGQVYVLFGPPSREEKRTVPESSRPALLWIYDKIRSTRIPANESLVFVYRDIKYVLLPPSAQEGDLVGEESRRLELSTLGYRSIPSVVQQAFVDVAQKNVVDEKNDYHSLLTSVTSTEKFGLPGIDFDVSRVQDQPLQFKITLQKESAPVTMRDQNCSWSFPSIRSSRSEPQWSPPITQPSAENGRRAILTRFPLLRSSCLLWTRREAKVSCRLPSAIRSPAFPNPVK